MADITVPEVESTSQPTIDNAFLFIDLNQSELSEEDWQWAKEEFAKSNKPLSKGLDKFLQSRI